MACNLVTSIRPNTSIGLLNIIDMPGLKQTADTSPMMLQLL